MDAKVTCIPIDNVWWSTKVCNERTQINVLAQSKVTMSKQFFLVTFILAYLDT
jgi:hypothetical protein